MLDQFDTISKNKTFSEDKINKFREKLQKNFSNDNICVVVVGSLARREASQESDVDFYVVQQKDSSNGNHGKEIKNLISQTLKEKDIKMKEPSKNGPFNEIIEKSNLLENIGGPNDSNDKLTRRMLFLLESDWIFNERLYIELKKCLLERYIKDYIKDHQLPQFLLNDIIRYYRTIATDFEYKTLDLNKDWGPRNIKLRFSRKLLYFSSIIVIAEIGFRKLEEQRKLAMKFFNMYPLERIVKICGIKATKTLQRYDYFLKKISDPNVRRDLENASYNQKTKNPEIFEELKNESKHFSWNLISLLRETFDICHPIHHHLIF